MSASGGRGRWVKPVPKPSLERCRSVYKISSRSVQGFGFPLALHIPTDKQTNICMSWALHCWPRPPNFEKVYYKYEGGAEAWRRENPATIFPIRKINSTEPLIYRRDSVRAEYEQWGWSRATDWRSVYIPCTVRCGNEGSGVNLSWKKFHRNVKKIKH